MTRQFSHRISLPARPERVFAILTDPDLLVARYTASGSANVRVLEHRAEAGRLIVVYRRVEAGPLPAPIASLVRGAAQITQTDSWDPADEDGRRHASWVVRAAGIAVEIGGSVELEPEPDGGTTLIESGTVSARLPLVGRLIERVAIEQSALKLRREWDWLATAL